MLGTTDMFVKMLMEMVESKGSTEFELANSYIKSGDPNDHKCALELYQIAAEFGHPLANVELGKMYLEGKGVTQDFKMAESYFLEAADYNATAQFNLALMYLGGRFGVARDYAKAEHYFLMGVQNDDENSIYELAYNYYTGECFKRDLDEALKLLQRVSLSRIGANYLMGCIYLEKKDYYNARQSFLKELNYGERSPDYFDASTKLGLIYLNGWGVKANPKKASKFFFQAIEYEDGFNDEAAYQLSCMFSQGMLSPYKLSKDKLSPGIVFREDKEQAISLLRDAAANGNAEACYQFALYCLKGSFGLVYRSDPDAWLLLLESAVQGHAEAHQKLIEFFESGRGQGCWYIEKSKSLYEDAVNGDAQAQYELAEILITLNSGEDNDDFYEAITFALETAKILCVKAAAQGHAEAMFDLAEIYVDNDFCDKDDHYAQYYEYIAGYWFDQALQAGSESAQTIFESAKTFPEILAALQESVYGEAVLDDDEDVDEDDEYYDEDDDGERNVDMSEENKAIEAALLAASFDLYEAIAPNIKPGDFVHRLAAVTGVVDIDDLIDFAEDHNISLTDSNALNELDSAGFVSLSRREGLSIFLKALYLRKIGVIPL